MQNVRINISALSVINGRVVEEEYTKRSFDEKPPYELKKGVSMRAVLYSGVTPIGSATAVATQPKYNENLVLAELKKRIRKTLVSYQIDPKVLAKCV